MKIAVLHNAVDAGARADELDVLAQVEAVTQALAAKGNAPLTLAAGANLDALADALAASGAELVFNLVESLRGRGELIVAAPALLASLDLPFTGAPVHALALSSDKLATKRILSQCDIVTPGWCTVGEDAARQGGTWIVKPVWEDGSVGIDDGSVVAAGAVAARLASCREQHGGEWFAERYIDGREFNVSLLQVPGGVLSLPVPEIRFTDFPAGKPRIVGYAAKWDEESFEARHTPRRFLARGEQALEAALGAAARSVWHLLGFAGYARVDMRVDGGGRIYVIEANANPCLAPDAGFQASLAEARMAFPDAIERIVSAARRDRHCTQVPRRRVHNRLVH